MNGWYAVDLDGTLAEYHGWPADGSIGKPIPAMVERVKGWLAEGKDVRIFTARVWPLGTMAQLLAEVDPVSAGRVTQAMEQRVKVSEWCRTQFGCSLRVTCVKDYSMISLYDDRAVQVEENTGKLVGVAE